MQTPVKYNLKIYQGGTFRDSLRWESSTKVYKPITAVAQSAPIQITAVCHGLPNGWRAKVTGVKGTVQINSDELYRKATVVSADVIEFNEVNAAGYSAYISGGILEYNQPVDLTGATARMQMRGKLTDTEVLLELTTENGGIVIDNTDKTITIVISATATAALTFTSAVYSMEIITQSGDVIPFITGTVSVVQEVTR